MFEIFEVSQRWKLALFKTFSGSQRWDVFINQILAPFISMSGCLGAKVLMVPLMNLCQGHIVMDCQPP